MQWVMHTWEAGGPPYPEAARRASVYALWRPVAARGDDLGHPERRMDPFELLDAFEEAVKRIRWKPSVRRALQFHARVREVVESDRLSENGIAGLLAEGGNLDMVLYVPPAIRERQLSPASKLVYAWARRRLRALNKTKDAVTAEDLRGIARKSGGIISPDDPEQMRLLYWAAELQA